MPASVLEVLIVGDSTQLTAALGKASGSVAAFNGQVLKSGSAVKSTLGSIVPVSAVAAGVAVAAFAKNSFQAATDYNAAFTKVDAITNASADQIAILKARAMELAGQTAQSPVELANAIYYLASAGLSAQQQMESLDAVAKGTAIGLGTSADLAKITAQALNVFGDSGLRAADVMDVLTAAVRTGTAEPNEFADALGRVLPIAQKAGLSFAQVAGSLAAMSNAGLKVNIATTSLRGMLQALVAPTHQSVEALAQMGLTVDDVVQSMEQNGIIDTLRMLDTQAKKNTQTTGQYNIMLRNIVPNIRALTGMFNLTTQDAAKVDEIFKEVANSQGDLQEAFNVTTQSSAFKLKKAFNDIAIAGQNLASAALPSVAVGLGVVGDHAAGLVQILLVLIGAKVVTFFMNLTRELQVAAAATRLEEAAATDAAAASEAQAAALVDLEVASGAVAEAQIAAAAASGTAAAQDANAALASAVLTKQEAELAAAKVGVTTSSVEEAAAVEADAAVKTADATATTGLGVSERFAAAGAALLSSELVAAAAVIYGIYKAVQGVKGQIDALHVSFTGMTGLTAGLGFNADWGAFFNSTNTAARAFNATLMNTQLPTEADANKMFDAMKIIQAGFLQAGLTADQQSQVIQGALHDMGVASEKDINPSNIQDYVLAIQSQIAAIQSQTAAQQQQAQIQRQILSDQNALSAATQGYQANIAKLAGSVDGLNTLTGDAQGFLTGLRSTLISSANPAVDFAKAITDLGTKWREFQQQAAGQLNFMPQALSDLTSAAQQAQSSLADALANPPDAHASAQTIRDYNANLATLRSQANLTAGDIVTAFKAAAKQSKQFFQDLLDISKVGGQAGKDLANELLQSGNVMAAQVIADAPGKLEKQIVHLSGAGTNMADTFATKLTNSIIGPLKDISKALKIIVEKTWHIDLSDNTQQTHDHIKGVQSDVDHLVGEKNKIVFTDNATVAQAHVANLNESLKKLPTHMLIDIKTHVHGSDLPDEVLRKHLFDPMKRSGFQKTTNGYSLPLDIAASTAVAPPGARTHKPGDGKAGHGDVTILKHIEATQLRVLAVEKNQADFLRIISKKGTGGGGGTGGTSSSGGSSTGGSSSGGSISDSSGFTGALGRMMHRFENTVKDIQGPMYAKRWAKEMAAQINKPGSSNTQVLLIKQFMRDMAKATNPAEAHKAADQFRKAIHDWEDGIRKQNQEAMQQHMQDVLDYAAKHQPRLPRGNTRHFDQREPHHHRRMVSLNMDRKRFTHSAGYEVDYGRGF